MHVASGVFAGVFLQVRRKKSHDYKPILKFKLDEALIISLTADSD